MGWNGFNGAPKQGGVGVSHSYVSQRIPGHCSEDRSRYLVLLIRWAAPAQIDVYIEFVLGSSWNALIWEARSFLFLVESEAFQAIPISKLKVDPKNGTVRAGRSGLV